MYEIAGALFVTPKGIPFSAWLRQDTNDWNTHNAILGSNDEYHIAGVEIEGNVLDIGGYLGTFGVAVALDNPLTSVTIVEPIPENVEMIRRNIAANYVGDRVTVKHAGVGDGSPVTIRYAFQFDANSLHHAFVGNANNVGIHDDRAHSEVTVPGLTPADFPGEYALVKIDCEGGEWGFFSQPGVERFARIVGEFHPTALPDGSTGSRSLMRRLLEPTHDVTFDGPEAGPGGFVATRR